MAPAAQADEPFGVESFSARTSDEAEAEYTVAGGHPFQTRIQFELKDVDDEAKSVEQPKDSSIDLPNGFFANPVAAPRCPATDIGVIPNCPEGSMVGFVFVAGAIQGLYDVAPDRGYLDQLVFDVFGTNVSLYVSLRPRTESYGLTVTTRDAARLGNLTGIDVTLCAYGAEAGEGSFSCNPPSGAEPPFLTNQVDCSDASPTWRLTIDSWENPGRRLPTGVLDLGDPSWKTASTPASPVSGCDDPALALQFDPKIDVKPLQGGGPLEADQPAGLAVDLDFPQSNDPTDSNTNVDDALPQAPEPREITVKLPAGLSISPSSADGLGACSDLASDPAGDQVHYDSVQPATCPNASKIGSVAARTPLLASYDPVTDAVTGAESIGGDVYLLKPHLGDLAQGQDGKFRLLIQLENPRYGVNFKLPGIAVADRQTGRLTATFTDNPQLPAKHLTVNLEPGPRALLATPATCSVLDPTTHELNTTIATDIVPWSTPGTPDATPSSSFAVASGPDGSPCVTNPAERPFAPNLSAGTESNLAGAASPFVLKLTRSDGEQELSSLDLTTPPGFSAKLAGVPYCSGAAIAAAAGKSGAAERSSPSCPAASQIGTVTAAAGPGSNPYYVDGKAYLSGPYRGAPLSFAFIAPAVAGPFDLGNVVVRAAIFVDPETARMTVRSDPLPRILDGMPLRLRSIAARIDRPDFALNPTNCEPMAIDAGVGGANGAGTSPSNSFQVRDCAKLGFKPKLALRLLGPTHRSALPKLRATLTPRQGDANIAAATVTLPQTELLESSHIRLVCSRPQFDAGACPRGSVYGRAEVTSPLLDEPLRGPVYLRNNPAHMLPDLVASLDGRIHLDVVAGLDSSRGRIRATFAPPDLPLRRLALTLFGGDRGLIVNTGGLCGADAPRVRAGFTAQSGRTHSASPLVRTDCAPRRPGSR